MADPTVVELANQMEEAFVTAIRTRLAAAQGRDFMAKALAAHRAKES